MTDYNIAIAQFKQFPPIIQLVWIASLIITVNVIILIVYLKYLRAKLRVNYKLATKFQDEHESSLITYLYSGSEDEDFSSDQKAVVKDLKSCVSDPFQRKLLVSTLLKLRNEITGELAESIDKLYIELGLVYYSLNKLKNRKWDVVAKAITELTQFQVKGIQDTVMKKVNHPKKEVRKEIQLYLVQLFSFQGLDFLSVLKTPLSEWDQIQLLEILQRSNDKHISDIKPWLQSSNESVVSFALKLAKIYNQYEVRDELLDLLGHANQTIRIHAIETLSHLNILEAKTILKDSFVTRSIEEQISSVKMFENLYEDTDKPFLMGLIEHENFEIRLGVMEILDKNNYDDSDLFELLTKKRLTA